MTQLSTLSSTFPGPALPSPWYLVSDTGSPTESFVGGALRVTASAGNNYRYYEAGPYQLTDGITSWFRMRPDGTASGFCEVAFSLSLNAAGPDIFAYVVGAALNTSAGSLTYDPAAHAWIGFKWISSSTINIYTAPDSSGVPGTPTLVGPASGGATSASQVWVDVALGSLGASPAYGELLAVNPSAGGASLTLGSTAASRSTTVGDTSFAAITTSVTYTGAGTVTATPSDTKLAASISAGTLTITAGSGLSALAAGTYAPTVLVSDSTLSQTFAVTLTVSAAAPTIALTPSSATINYTQGTAAPAGGSVAISNSGTGSLPGLALGPITFS